MIDGLGSADDTKRSRAQLFLRWKAKRRERKLLWYRGARVALCTLKDAEGGVRIGAQTLLRVPGMTHIVRDDHWVKGFVAMLKRKAGLSLRRTT